MQLVPGALSPMLARWAVRLGSLLSFSTAAELVSELSGTSVSHDTVRRLTEEAGAVWRQLELELVEQLEAVAVTPGAEPALVVAADPVAPERAALISVDGAMIPLVDSEWAEARTLVIAELRAGKAVRLSYACALAPAAEFSRQILGEVTRRGISAHPGPVVAVTDGVPWIQELLDLHCPAAVRVLDLMHVLEYLANAAKRAFGPGTEATAEWIVRQRLALRAGEVDAVLSALTELPVSDERTAALRYLTARQMMLDYPRCLANGWPVGSGVVESANKLVVEARLKGAGRHWRRAHADAMLALRAVDASGRWATAWPQIVAGLRAARRERTAIRRTERRAAAAPTEQRLGEPTGVAALTPPMPPTEHLPAPETTPCPLKPKRVVNGKPTRDHPWRRHTIGRQPPLPTKSH